MSVIQEYKSALRIPLRKPEWPVIVISRDRVLSGQNPRSLASALCSALPSDHESFIRVVDSAGSEFWFYPDMRVLSPSFVTKRWSKKKLIDLYNADSFTKVTGRLYSPASLSNKRLSQIVQDLCDLISES